MILNILLFSTVVLALLALEAKQMPRVLVFFGVFGAISSLIMFLLKSPEPTILKLLVELGILFWLIRQISIEDNVGNAPKTNLVFLVIFGGLLAAFCLPLARSPLAFQVVGEAIPLVLLLIGLYGLVVKRNLVKTLLGLMILEYSIALFAALHHAHTSIFFTIISLATTLVAAIFILALYNKYNTLDISKIRKLEG